MGRPLIRPPARPAPLMTETFAPLSALGLGTGRLASLGRAVPPRDLRRMLEIAAENRVNVIDTANAYGSGDAERLIAKCLGQNRRAFFVITKAGLPYVDAPGWMWPLNQVGKKLLAASGRGKNFGGDYLVRCAGASMRRFGGTAPDAFLLHEPMLAELHGAETWEALERIRGEGLAHHTGVCTIDPRVVEEGLNSGQVDIVETSAAWNDTRGDEILRLCRGTGVTVIVNDVLRPARRISKLYARNLEAIHALDGLQGMDLAQFLLAAAFVEKKPHVVLFGTSSVAHMASNIGSLKYREAVARYLSRIERILS